MNTKKVHPAWFILVACCFLQAGGIGTLSNSAGILVPAVLGDLKFSQGSFTLYMTIQGLCMVAALPIAGKLLPKVNIRALVSIGMVLSAAAFASMSQFHYLWQWYIAGGVLGFASGFVFLLPAPIMIGNWFKKKAGLAMGLSMSCSGIGGAIMNPVGGFFIREMGWRPTYVIMAVVALALVLPFSLFVIRFRPADIGMAPYGEEEGALAQAKAAKGPAGTSLPGVSARDALRSQSFICIFLVAGLLSFASTYMLLLPTFAGTIGLAAIAAYMSSSVMVGNILGKLFLGWLNDKAGIQGATLMGLAMVAISFVLFLFAETRPALALTGALLYGMVMSMVSVCIPLIVRKAYGPKDYSMIFSYVSMATSLIGSFGITIIALMYDAFQTYIPSFYMGMVVCIITGIFLVLGFLTAKKLPVDQPDLEPVGQGDF